MPDLKLEGPIPGEPFAVLGAFDLAASGYRGEEWIVSGRACSFAPTGERSPDGDWSVHPEAAADFRSRILVRRPMDSARFDGTVFVEWLNVSGGLDAAPDWLFSHRHVMREGSVWIGVSAQKAGIDGGGLVPGMPLKQADAERYGGLVHPGDAFAYDLFTQIGHALRDGASGPLADLRAERVLAVGESQSAGFLVSYVNAVDPFARAYDAYLIHGRPGAAAGLDGRYLRGQPDGELPRVSAGLAETHRIREDVRVPVLVLQSETDVVSLGSGRARQPDTERIRLWEMAGAAHFDTYGMLASMVDDGRLSIEELAERLAPTDRPLGLPARAPINAGPQQHYIAQAALAHLVAQVRGGDPPPVAPRLETSDPLAAEILRDELGIARGGIRTPWVEVPSSVLSGLGQDGEGFLFLFGTTQPLASPVLDRLYPGGADEHVRSFETSLADAVAQGFLLEADAEEIRALARHGRQPSGWRVD